MTTRDNFVEHFGEPDARAIELAAESHADSLNSNDKGSDEFRWAIIICIGYECVSRSEFRASHGITTPWSELRKWIKLHGNIGEHEGYADCLSMLAGIYDEFLETHN